MGKRLFDLVCSFVSIIVLSPVFILTAIGIKLGSRGPVFFHAARVGLAGVPFVMYKFRTMNTVQQACSSAITGYKDVRVFPFGALLRYLKIDELPQLLNIIKGDMSIVGPRPEDVDIVKRCYDEIGMKTLLVRPGLASPGSLYSYIRGEKLLVSSDIENCYTSKLLPMKLALDYVYMRRRSFFYDLRIIGYTLFVIILKMMGRRQFPELQEMAEAERIAGKMDTAL